MPLWKKIDAPGCAAQDLYFWQKGTSAPTWSWRQSVTAEHATYTGQHVVAALLDIERAFDSVDRGYLHDRAAARGYDMNILRFLLQLYRMTRIIVVQRVATRPVIASRSIVPRDSNADTLMLVCMLTPSDSVSTRFPEIHLGFLADDIQLPSVSKHSAV